MIDKIETIKNGLGIETSEILFGIDPQPNYQCSDIDSYIQNNSMAVKDIKYYVHIIKGSDDLEHIEKLVGFIEDESNCLDNGSELEDLRLACVKIREWGQQWKDIAKRLINEQDTIADLVADEYLDKVEELTF